MKIAILGFAREGHAAYDYWAKNNEVTICDQNKDLKVPDGAQAQLGPDYLKNLNTFDLIVRSAGLHPRLIAEANPGSPHIMDKVTSNTNELIRACPSRNIIGVTGTKGKGTTSTLIQNMLQKAGHTVHLGGNIGTAALELLKEGIQPNDWVVLELSSFQLMDLQVSPSIAVCLAIVEEHLNWHTDMHEYVSAKQQLFAHQAEGDIAVYCADNQYSLAIAKASPGLVIPYMADPGAFVTDNVNGEEYITIAGHKICDTNELKLLGKHNWQNVCAALTVVWQACQDIPALRRAITEFRGLEYRLELIRTLNGVRYYNDSFSSAPDATIAALSAVSGPKVLVIGGVDKNQDFSELSREILAHQTDMHRIIVIGEVAPKIEASLQAHGIANYDILRGVDMKDIVASAQSTARPGDAVLFSPASSSFDMFKDITDRSQQFTKVVQALEPADQ